MPLATQTHIHTMFKFRIRAHGSFISDRTYDSVASRNNMRTTRVSPPRPFSALENAGHAHLGFCPDTRVAGGTVAECVRGDRAARQGRGGERGGEQRGGGGKDSVDEPDALQCSSPPRSLHPRCQRPLHRTVSATDPPTATSF
eukprot:2225302-Rhodomonas_salina.4